MTFRNYTIKMQTTTGYLVSTGSVSTTHSIDGLSMVIPIAMLSRSKSRMSPISIEDQELKNGQMLLEDSVELIPSITLAKILTNINGRIPLPN